MQKCFYCGNYILEDNFYDFVDKNDDKSIIKAVLICPCCGARSIIGAEEDIDFDTGKNCWMMFGGDYYSKRDHDLPRIIGILTYRGTSVDKATHTIVGHHENLESGVLYWFPNLQQAKVVKREMKKDPRSSNIKIKTKDEALNLK